MRLQVLETLPRGSLYANADTGMVVGKVIMLVENGRNTPTFWRAEPASDLPPANFASIVAATHYLKAASYERVLRLEVNCFVNQDERFKEPA